MIEPAQAHELALPARADTEKPLASALPKVERSGVDAVDLLGATMVPAEAGDHLVEDQKRAIGVAEILQLMQEAVLGLLGARRLQDEARRSGRDVRRTAP